MIAEGSRPFFDHPSLISQSYWHHFVAFSFLFFFLPRPYFFYVFEKYVFFFFFSLLSIFSFPAENKLRDWKGCTNKNQPDRTLPWNMSIGYFYAVQKHGSTDSEALKVRYVWSEEGKGADWEWKLLYKRWSRGHFCCRRCSYFFCFTFLPPLHVGPDLSFVSKLAMSRPSIALFECLKTQILCS